MHKVDWKWSGSDPKVDQNITKSRYKEDWKLTGSKPYLRSNSKIAMKYFLGFNDFKNNNSKLVLFRKVNNNRLHICFSNI